jgi:hypothetical protein
MYDMPLEYDHIDIERQVDKVITLKIFLKSCLYLMKYETTLCMLHGMIYHCAQDREEVFAQRAINQVHQKRRTNREF